MERGSLSPFTDLFRTKREEEKNLTNGKETRKDTKDTYLTIALLAP